MRKLKIFLMVKRRKAMMKMLGSRLLKTLIRESLSKD